MDNIKKYNYIIFFVCLFLAGCDYNVMNKSYRVTSYDVQINPQIDYDDTEYIEFVEDEDENENENKNIRRTTTVIRIHESLPKFSFVRTVDYKNVDYFNNDIPISVAVKIEIFDEYGELIQSIENLTQSMQSGNTADISFGDYNFDGFLDMRLMRWQEGAGSLLANEYFWLWDSYSFQFVFNKQLMSKEQLQISLNKYKEQISILQRRWSETLLGVGVDTYVYIYDQGKFHLIHVIRFDD